MSVMIHVAGCLIRIAVLSPSIRAASTGGSFVESMIRIERNAALCPTRFSCTRVQRRRTVWCGTKWPSFCFARRRTRRTLIVGSSVPTKITSTSYPLVAASRNRPRRHCRVNVVSMPKLAPAARHLARAAATSGHRPSRSVVASRLKKSSGSSFRCRRVQRDLPAPLAPINSTTLGGATLIRFPKVPSTVPGTSSRAGGNRWAGVGRRPSGPPARSGGPETKELAPLPGYPSRRSFGAPSPPPRTRVSLWRPPTCASTAGVITRSPSSFGVTGKTIAKAIRWLRA